MLCITRAWALLTRVIAAPDTPGPVREPVVEDGRVARSSDGAKRLHGQAPWRRQLPPHVQFLIRELPDADFDESHGSTSHQAGLE